MAAHPHIAQWVKDFEAQYGSRPYYYGPLDRDARKVERKKYGLKKARRAEQFTKR